MSGETMREAVALEVRKFASEPEAATLTATQFILNRDDAIAQAAIRTVLERLREPTSAMLGAVDHLDGDKYVARGIAVDAWQAMIDAAAKEAIAPPLPESADSGRG